MDRAPMPSSPARQLDRLTLRFVDSGLERAFQESAGLDFRRQLLVSLLVGFGTWALAGILIPLIYLVDPVRIGIAIGAIEACILAVLIAFRRVRTWDQEQLCNGLVNLVGGFGVIGIGGFLVPLTELVPTGLLLNMLFAFGGSRLGFRVGIGATLPYVIVFALLVMAGRLAGLGGFQVFLVLVGLGVAASAGYMLELSTRRLFLQQQTISTQAIALAAEKEKSEQLLRVMLPEPIVTRLREQPEHLADLHAAVSVLFADLVGFTPLANRLAPKETVELLDELFSRFDALAASCGLEKIKTIGDAYMAVAGVPQAEPDHAIRAVILGLDMLRATAEYVAYRRVPLGLRVGVHSGPAVAGVIGRTRFSYDLWGDTVNIASRMESQGVAGAVQVSDATAQLIRGAFALEPRGTIEVRGKGPMQTFLVRDAEPRMVGVE